MSNRFCKSLYLRIVFFFYGLFSRLVHGPWTKKNTWSPWTSWRSIGPLFGVSIEQAQKEFDYCQKKLNYEEANCVNQLTAIRNGLEMAKKIHLENNLQQGIPNSNRDFTDFLSFQS